MSIVERAVWIIESNLNSQLSLQSIADKCAVTHFHLSRVFRSTTGTSLMAYVRARRLSEAARVLASGEADILRVALDSQYNSHEAFTRAFSAYLGVSPRTVRERRCISQLKIMEHYVVDTSLLINLDSPEIKIRDSFSVTGISKQYTFEKNLGIPAQWQSFNLRYKEITKPISQAVYGVCYDADSQGRFSYLVGLETDKNHVIPVDMRKTIYTIWNKALED